MSSWHWTWPESSWYHHIKDIHDWQTKLYKPCPSSRSHLPESDTLQTCHNSSSVILISTFKEKPVNFQWGISQPRSASFLSLEAKESMLVCIQLQTFYSTFRGISNKNSSHIQPRGQTRLRNPPEYFPHRLPEILACLQSLILQICDHILAVFSCVPYQAFWARIFLHLPTSTSHLIRLSWSFLFGNLLAVCFMARIEFIGV